MPNTRQKLTIGLTIAGFLITPVLLRVARESATEAKDQESSLEDSGAIVVKQETAPSTDAPGVREESTEVAAVSIERKIADLLSKPLDPSNPAARAELVAELRRLEDLQQEETELRAEELGLAMRTEQGAVLTGFSGDQPLYDVSHNQDAAISIGTDLVRDDPPYSTGGGGKMGLWDVDYAPSTDHFDIKDGVDIKDNALPYGDHASHVAGTIMGKGLFNSAARGMSPASELWCYSSFNVLSELAAAAATGPADVDKLFVSVHPYGSAAGWEFDSTVWFGNFSDDGVQDNDYAPLFGQYSDSAAAWDGLAWNSPYHLSFKSSGNHRDDEAPENGALWSVWGLPIPHLYDGGNHPKADYELMGNDKGYGTIDARASAKNVLTIGSVSDAVLNGLRDPDEAVLSPFSSAGPTDDGRIKPDLVANGEGVLSVDSWTEDDYYSADGTSMAVAAAGGSAQLLVKRYQDLYPGDSMRASSLKGLLIHTADDLGKTGPDYQYGWGLMNIAAAAALLEDHRAGSGGWVNLVEQRVTNGNPADEYTFTHDGGPLRVTICWTDPAGNPTSGHDDRTPALVNDLNLTVTELGGTTSYPYYMEWVGTWEEGKLDDEAKKGVNTVDNVEQVYLNDAAPGQYTIRVDHAGSISQGPQHYALWISGAKVFKRSNVLVQRPVDDVTFPITTADPISVADVNDVFTNQARSFAIAVSPGGIFTAQIDVDGVVSVTPTVAAFGTSTVTLTAWDINGNVAVDEFEVTIIQGRFYVNADTPANAAAQNGWNWGTAYESLQDALGAAAAGSEIWVAAGVYRPDEVGFADTDDRSLTFTVPRGVSVYAGFSGVETTRGARSASQNVTILSGDLQRDDSVRPIGTYVGNQQCKTDDNSYRVVDLSACEDGDLFDGFVVTGGNADSIELFAADGGGINLGDGDVTVSNCLIIGNSALEDGGGVLVGGNTPRLVNCLVVGNVAGASGGGLYSQAGDLDIVSCEFRGNSASDGGAIYLKHCSATLSNCVVSGNRGVIGAAGLEVNLGGVVLSNCTFTANQANSLGAAIRIMNSWWTCEISNCIIWDNKSGNSMTQGASVYWWKWWDSPLVRNTIMAGTGGSVNWDPNCGTDGGNNLDINPEFTAGIQPSTYVNGGGDFTLVPTSPAIEAGSLALLPMDVTDLDGDGDLLEPLPLDLLGNDRFASGFVDLGAYEFTPSLDLDSDGDGLSDEFELTHCGDAMAMDASADLDGDGLTALAEFIHGENPNGPLTQPVGALSTQGVGGQVYLTITYHIDPQALKFATYAVQRRGLLDAPEGWVEGETVQISSRVSPTNPDLIEIVERSIFPIGTERMEFMRIRHGAIANPSGY